MFGSHTKYPNLWNVEANIHGQESLTSRCLFKGDEQSLCDNLWGLRPETSLSLHLAVKKSRKIYARRTWIRSGSRNSLPRTFGLWRVETCLPGPLISAHGRGRSKFMDNFGFKNINSGNLKVACSPGPFSRCDQPVEEPWLLESSVSSQSIRQGVASICLTSEEKSLKPHVAGGFTLEEPHVHDSKLETNSGITRNELSIQSIIALKKESVDRVLLINSSLQTMQRLAVLEDGKLVEIVTEPMKNEVQVGNIYLGIVREVLPDMGGVLIDIGSSRNSLMKTTKVKPLIFPPFPKAQKQKNVNGYLHGNWQVDADDPVQNVHDDFGEHETDNEVKAPDHFSRYINGSVTDSAFKTNGKGHVDQPIGCSQNSHPKTMSSPTVALKSSNNAKYLHVQDMRSSWAQVEEGDKILVQVTKKGSGTEGPRLSPRQDLQSRFWVLKTCGQYVLATSKASQSEKDRLVRVGSRFRPAGTCLIARTAAVGRSKKELEKDLVGLLSAWEGVAKQATSAALAADEGIEDAVPVMLYRLKGHTLSVFQDYLNNKFSGEEKDRFQVNRMVVDSRWAFDEVRCLREMNPDLCARVELYNKRTPLFEEYKIEEELKNILDKRVPLSNGGDLVIEQTEAFISIDVNGGQAVNRNDTSSERAILDINLLAAKEIARQIRLREIGGLIVVDFIDMSKKSHKERVYREVKNAVVNDRQVVEVSELSNCGLMEITRQKVRPSVADMISEACTCCDATGRVEALETTFSKITREIYRLCAMMGQRPDSGKWKSRPTFILWVERDMYDYLTSYGNKELANFKSSLKVKIWLQLKVDRSFSRGMFKVEQLDDMDEDQGAIHSLQPPKAEYTYSLEKYIFPRTGDTSVHKVNIFPEKRIAR